MKQRIRLKLYENTNSEKVHLHQVIKRQDGSFFTRAKSLCQRHDRTDDHSDLWRQGSISSKEVLINLLPDLAEEDMEHLLCEWCLMEILGE